MFAVSLPNLYAASLLPGQVVINEVLPAPSDGIEWIELYNTTDTDLDISLCYIDDISGGGGSMRQIPDGTMITAHGYWTKDFSSYFNNSGDDARFLNSDGSTVLDSYTYGGTEYNHSWYRLPDGGDWQVSATDSPTKGASNGDLGGGTWTEGNLEIHHINIGQGDATLVVGPSGKSILIDAGESYWNSSTDAKVIGPYIQGVLGHKNLDYVLITHFHCDHIGYVGYGGLWHLVEVQGFSVGNMIHRDYNTYLGATSSTFNNWKTYLEGEGSSKLNPVIARECPGQVDLGSGVIFDIKVTDGNGDLYAGDFSADANPPSENDYSIGVKISFGSFDEWIGGDLDGEYYVSSYGYTYHDIEWSAAPDVGDVDVFKVNHHGSDHSNNATFVNQLDPEVSIISVGDENTYGHPRQSVIDLLLSTSDVFMTEHGDPGTDIGDSVVAGHIVIKTSDGISYNINGSEYTATNPVRTDDDGDGYFVEVDPDDNDPYVKPDPIGGRNPLYQPDIASPPAPNPPTITKVKSGKKSVKIYWDTSDTVDSYSLYRSVISGGPYILIKDNIPDYYYYWKDNGLLLKKRYKRYYYVMTATIDGVESTFSNEVSAAPYRIRIRRHRTRRQMKKIH